MRIILCLTAILLVSCTQVIDDRTISNDQQKDLSWEEKAIAEIVKYEGWTEKNLNLSMEQLMDKMTKCREFAIEEIGEITEVMFDGAKIRTHEHRYSPRFDMCFSKRVALNDGFGVIDSTSNTFFFDVVKGKIFYSHNNNCNKDIDKSIYTDEEVKDRCPTDRNLDLFWDALVEKN